MKRKHLWLLACACALTGSAAVAQSSITKVATETEDEGCTCSSCSPGSQDCVYIICSDPSQSGMCKGKYNDT